MAFAGIRHVIRQIRLHMTQLPMLEETDEFVLAATMLVPTPVYDDIYSRKRIGYIKIKPNAGGIPLANGEYIIVTLDEDSRLYANFADKRVRLNKMFLVESIREMSRTKDGEILPDVISKMLTDNKISIDIIV